VQRWSKKKTDQKNQKTTHGTLFAHKTTPWRTINSNLVMKDMNLPTQDSEFDEMNGLIFAWKAFRGVNPLTALVFLLFFFQHLL
jgi:hypothetical protein